MTEDVERAEGTTPVPALETRELTRFFGTTHAVNGVSFSVGRGEMLALVGPDGAGKTTTIRMLTGVLKPTSGTATVLGHDLVRERDAVKRSIGYLSQVFSLYGDLTVDENIEFFAQIHGVRRFQKRREELLAFTRLAPFRRRLAGNLSGGMKQKLALACTLIHAPALIFLDEPTTGVDPVSRRDFWIILSDLLREGITIVLATPYLDEAERCHTVALMHEGRIIRRDTPTAIVEAFGKRLLEVVCEDARAAYRAIKQAPEWEEAQMFGSRIHVPVEDVAAGTQRLQQALEDMHFHVASIREIPPSLEDAFISEIRHSEGLVVGSEGGTAA